MWPRYRPGVAQRVGRVVALLFHDHDTRRGWVVSSTPWPTLPPGKNRYPFYRRLGGLQGRSGQARKIARPPGIDPRTIQPVVSRYTDWANRPTFWEGSVGFSRLSEGPMAQKFENSCPDVRYSGTYVWITLEVGFAQYHLLLSWIRLGV
jgi:hypothetical protein